VRYLGLALFAEGPTDHRFLSPILRRTAEELCLQYSTDQIEISNMLELHSPLQYRNQDRARRIVEAARQARGAYNILFMHTDGASDPERAWQERIRPAVQRLIVECANVQERPVAVVPIRETEAWALVDGEALRGAFGTVLDDVDLGIPNRPREVERIADPKQALDRAFDRVIGSRRRRKKKAPVFLNVIGERVRLALLRQVPAFQRFEQDLRTALTDLGCLDL